MDERGLTTEVASISHYGARVVLDAAVAKAAELGAASTIAIVDAQGLLKAMIRMDGSPMIGVDLARQKAYTCLAMGRDTVSLSNAVGGNAPVLAALTSLPDVALLPGGAPLKTGDLVVGAIGVSAPSGGFDVPIAAAGMAALEAT